MRLKVVLDTLFVPDHPTALSTKEVNVYIMERETELEEYSPRDRGLKSRLTVSIPLWAQIRLSDWFARQWERGGREPFLDLTALWRKMHLQEAWDPSIPPIYKLDLKASTRSGKRSGEAPI